MLIFKIKGTHVLNPPKSSDCPAPYILHSSSIHQNPQMLQSPFILNPQKSSYTCTWFTNQPQSSKVMWLPSPQNCIHPQSSKILPYFIYHSAPILQTPPIMQSWFCRIEEGYCIDSFVQNYNYTLCIAIHWQWTHVMYTYHGCYMYMYAIRSTYCNLHAHSPPSKELPESRNYALMHNICTCLWKHCNPNAHQLNSVPSNWLWCTIIFGLSVKAYTLILPGKKCLPRLRSPAACDPFCTHVLSTGYFVNYQHKIRGWYK